MALLSQIGPGEAMLNQIPVVIAGAGITGLSAALHLAETGVQKILIVTGPSIPTSMTAPGMLTGGQRDNFTRVAAAHQTDFAKTMWQFGDRAFDLTTSWARNHGVPLATSRRLRLIATPEELTEATIAVRDMSSAGLASQLLRDKYLAASPWARTLGPRILAVQDDGERGGWIEAETMHRKLRIATQAYPAVQFIDGTVENISGYADPELSVSIRAPESQTGNKKIQTIKASFVIAACHLAIGDLIPSLKSALVSSADQWLNISGPLDSNDLQSPWNSSGIAWSAFHNHEWGATQPNGKMLLGGGRILRKWAGFEATESKVEVKISKYIIEQTKKSFPHWRADCEPLLEAAGLDCHPCDELPIVGPMYGEGRILVATGFMGQGLTLGFYSGFCLAKLLMTGRCDDLPRRLWPERLRSLPDQE